MKIRSGIFLVLVFFSGAAGLVYQMAWFRQLRLVFGLSTAANAAVLAVFLGGLGIGGALLGRRADRHPRPLILYGTLEILVAMTAAATPLLLRLARNLYLLTGGEAGLGFLGASIVRVLVTVLVLAAPTVLLGGTLPALVRAFESDQDPERRRTALAYGVNTLGGVLGVCLATFVLIEFFGERVTILVAACASAVVGVVALRLGEVDFSTGGTQDPAPVETDGQLLSISPALVLGAAAAAGFVFFLMEIVWYRMLAPILGGTTFTFGVILAVALLGIAVGGGLYALMARGRPATPGAFAATMALEGVAMAVPFALGDRLALLAAFSSDFSGLGFGGSLASWFLVASIVVLPAAMVAGYQFPLLVGLLGTGRQGVGRHVGLAYAFNTMGSIAGALLGGFVLLTWLGVVNCWRLAVVLCLGISLVTTVVTMLSARRSGQHTMRAVSSFSVVMLVLASVLITSLGPTAVWRHAGIGAGRSSLDGHDPNDVRRFVHNQRRQLIWEADGRENSVGLEAGDSYAFVLNGKVDGNAVNDAGTQVMSGLLGMLIHPDPRSVLVVGLGTGSTAGWMAEVAAVERVHVLELEPEIEHIARVCAPVNRDVLDNPKVTIAYGDAREALLTSREEFDLVVSEPSNPYRAGIASLFTEEFYRHVSDRLNERGLFLQWFQGYEVDTNTVAVVLNTLASVFPEVQVWRTLKNDLLLMASNSPIEVDLETLRERVDVEPYEAAMRATWHTHSAEGVLARFVAGSALARGVHDGGLVSINTDDRNQLEFMLAKSVGRHGHFRVETMREAARNIGAGRPPIAPGSSEPEWALVEREVIGAFHEEPDSHFKELEELPDFHRAWRRGYAHAALEIWESSKLEPRTDTEIIGLGSALSRVGDPAAETFLAGLAGSYPTEAALLEGRMWLERGDPRKAFEFYQQAGKRLTESPWAHPGIFRTYFEDLDRLANIEPALAEKVFDLLESPLSVERAKDERLWARLRVAALIGPEQFSQALADVEPWVPWDPWLLQGRAQVRSREGGPAVAAAIADAAAFAENASIPFTSIYIRRQDNSTTLASGDHGDPEPLEAAAR